MKREKKTQKGRRMVEHEWHTLVVALGAALGAALEAGFAAGLASFFASFKGPEGPGTRRVSSRSKMSAMP